MQQTIISFPDIKLGARHAHKLRGYFGQLFRERSPLLHNHLEDSDQYRYRYPLVQYKVVHSVPMLVGFGEGAQLLMELFLEIDHLLIDEQYFAVGQKNIECKEVDPGYAETLIEYEFQTLWMALNQNNYREWQSIGEAERQPWLQKILVAQVLSAFKGMEVFLVPEQRLLGHLSVKEKRTQFKNQQMVAFSGSFLINAHLAPYMGIGKSVARGFGTILPKQTA